MGEFYTAEFLLIFSDDILLSKTVNHLKKTIEGNEAFEFKVSDDEDLVKYKNNTYTLKVKKNGSDVNTYRSYVIKTSTTEENTDDDNKRLYSEFNNEILKTLREVRHSQLNTLQDDVSSEYCQLSYRLIHDIENKMRKLITIFMTTKVGLEWVSANTPQSVIDSIKNDDVKKGGISFNNFLSETDFIQLSNFLFTKYATIKLPDIHRELQSEAVDVEKLKEFIPRSNWERHFSSLITIKEDAIVKIWENLYDLRNKVAHNRFITYEEYRKIVSNKDRMERIIDEALSKIDSVEVSAIQKESIKTEVQQDGDIEIIDNKKNKNLYHWHLNSKSQNKINDQIETEDTIREISRLLYSDIDDSIKNSLRIHRNKIKSMLSMMQKSKNKELISVQLELETKRASDYINELKNFTSI